MRLSIFGSLLILSASCLADGWDGAYIGGETAEGKCFYEAGETMTFRLQVGGIAALPEGTWTLRWTRTGDDGVTQTGSAPVSLAEPCVVTTSLDRPGFVRIQACVDGVTDAVRFDGGAGVDFGNIVANQGEPSDFEAFWRRQLAVLGKTGISPQLTEIESPKDGVKLYTFRLACSGGKPATGYLSVPDAAGPFPARMFFYGYGQSWQASVLRPPAAADISAGEIQLRVNAHGLELGRSSAYYDAAKASVSHGAHLHGWNPADNERPETCYFLGMVLRGVRAAQYVRTMEKWNGSRLIVEGGSQGAMQSITVASLCPWVTEAQVYINWMCDVRGKAFGGRLASEFQPEYRPGLDYFDEVFHARRIGTNCYVNVKAAGLGDYISPPSGIACFYNALRCRKRIDWRQNYEHSWKSPAPGQASFTYTAERRADPGRGVVWGERVMPSFSADAAADTVTGGAWTVKPPIVEGRYRMTLDGDGGDFSVSDRSRGVVRLTSRMTPSGGYREEDMPSALETVAALSPRDALFLVDGRVSYWARARRTQDGWGIVRLCGAENPEDGLEYDIMMEIDTTRMPAQAGYWVGPSGGGFVQLTDEDGRAWFELEPGAYGGLADVRYGGELALASLYGERTGVRGTVFVVQ